MEYVRSEWWLTPIWEVQTDFDNEFNEALSDEIYNIAKDIKSGKDRNPKNSLWDYETPHLVTIKKEILRIASDTVLKSIEEAQQLNLKLEYSMGWVNVKGPGEFIDQNCGYAISYSSYQNVTDKIADKLNHLYKNHI